MAAEVAAQEGLDCLLETSWFGSYAPSPQSVLFQVSSKPAKGDTEPTGQTPHPARGSPHSGPTTGDSQTSTPRIEHWHEPCLSLLRARTASQTLFGLPAPGTIAAAVAKPGLSTGEQQQQGPAATCCSSSKGTGAVHSALSRQLSGASEAVQQWRSKSGGVAHAKANVQVQQHVDSKDQAAGGPGSCASLQSNGEKQITDVAWHFRFRKRWLAAYKTDNSESLPLIDPGLLTCKVATPQCPTAPIATANSSDDNTPNAANGATTFDSAVDPMLLVYGDSPQGWSPVGSGPGAAAAPALTAAPALGAAATAAPALPAVAVAAAAAAAQEALAAALPHQPGAGDHHEHSDDEQPTWVGSLLPPVVIDSEGQFNLILANVVDSLAGCNQLVLRGRRRANTAQLVDELKLEVARRAVEASLPVQASVSLLARGTMLVQAKKISIACSSCCSTTELFCASQGSPMDTEGMLSSASASGGAGACQPPRTSGCGLMPTAFDSLAVCGAPSGMNSSSGFVVAPSRAVSNSLTTFTSTSSASCTADSPAAAPPGAQSAALLAGVLDCLPLPHPADMDCCAVAARMLYEALPYDYCIVRVGVRAPAGDK